ncbi:ABC transporter ATP-binding protein [Fertoebacter nigrum]|uniref:ABC transporter ATP-binding protein n=1 Tax=Fertoeibacter niger TaxID=2656921 RepID=A0A8X8GXP2_9RHOB|nr:ABC transporter ATP-binding protein [Fertoeibacter niger]NUB45027.1 ABC transporter ATP-binding protein [Fertoeibacter niger]
MTADTYSLVKPALELRNLSAWYGESRALYDVSLDVKPGGVVSLLGRNGAGKTTIVKSIMGLMNRREGSVRFENRETIGLSPRKIALLGIGLVPEERGIFGTLTVQENLMLPPVVRDGGMTLERIFDLFPNVRARLTAAGNALSGGEQQMLAIARILRTGARAILLDEPTEGLAPVIVQQIRKTIESMKEMGFTILLVEQNFDFAARVSDAFVVIENGRVVDRLEGPLGSAEIESVRRFLSV